MARASDAEKAERLNRARELLRRFERLPDAVERLAHDCSISPRQAYRYLQQAQRLKEPVPVGESKLAFTVKLPRSLIQRVRLYASVRKLSISEVVSRALLALATARARSWLSRSRPSHAHCSWSIVSIVCCRRSWPTPIRFWCRTSAGRSPPPSPLASRNLWR